MNQNQQTDRTDVTVPKPSQHVARDLDPELEEGEERLSFFQRFGVLFGAFSVRMFCLVGERSESGTPIW